MKQKFGEVEKILRQTAQARQDAKSAIARLEAQRKDYSAEYAKANIDPKIKEARAELKARQEEVFYKVAQLLQDLSQAATTKQSKLSLDNPAWANALKLIELSGSTLDPETVKKINASFAGDQSALRALKGVYKAHGVAYNGGLENQIYEPESAFGTLREYGYNAFIREGSLNSLASAVSKIAALEGIEFPKMVDEAGAEEVMRAAAGLADVVTKGE